MDFLADECCNAGLVRALRQDGHDIIYVGESFVGLTDDDVLKHAFENRRIILTEDKDFGDLTVRLKKPAIGVVLLRLDPGNLDRKIERTRRLIADFGDRLSGHYCVVQKDRFRFRILPNPLP